MLLAESTGSAFGQYFSGEAGKEILQIKAHETIPHKPPATKTASGLECVPSPPTVVSSCLLLSYVIKYIPVPSVSRTIS